MKTASVELRWILGISLAGAAAACAFACGPYSTQGAGDGFVGTWSCPGLPADARTIQIGAALDNSLVLQSVGDAGTPFCGSDLWSYSGSTATMKSGTSCLGGTTGTQVITIQSFALTLNGSQLDVSAKETITVPDGGAATQTVTLSGACTKQP